MILEPFIFKISHISQKGHLATTGNSVDVSLVPVLSWTSVAYNNVLDDLFGAEE